MKKQIAILAMLLLAGLANAAVTNLFPNGNFDSPAGTGAPWAEVFDGGTTTYSYPTSGGNPSGYGVMNNTSGWGIWVGGATTPLSLTSLGLVAGGTYTFVMDMKNITGTGIGKLKIESWAGGVMLSDSGEIAASSQSTSWATYTFPVTLNAGATGIKVVPVAGAASQIGFDNLGVIVSNTPLAVVVTSPANNAVVTTNFSIDTTATVTPGTVTNVSFYDGVTLLGSDATSPYSYSVSGATLGAHALKVIAKDSSGNSATSSVVNVIVTNATSTGWQLVWSDEFEGTSVDSAKWSYDIGNGCPDNCGWGNNEQQYYTSRATNVYVAGGFLNIVARKEVPKYNNFDYTSAKLKTAGKFGKTYGRFEFRARLPQGKGYWPALWMMPQDSVYGGWAASGEIDILENKGRQPTIVSGAIHYGGQWPNNTYSFAEYTFPNGGVATDFHVYALEWSTNSLKWYVDGVLFQTRTSWHSTAAPYPAPFNQPFYLIINLAVGGNFDGNPDGSTVFPGLMQVDYVRVYSFSNAPVAPPTPPTTSGVLSNGGFESGLLAPWVGKDFANANPSGGVIMDTNGLVWNPVTGAVNTQNIKNPANGMYSCKVYGNYTGGVNSPGFYQDVDALPGSLWTASIKARTQNTDHIRDLNQAVVEVSFFDNTSTVLAKYASQVFTTNTPINTWITMAVTNRIVPAGGPTNLMRAPAGTYRLRFEVTYTQPLYEWGSIYFDEAQLQEVAVTRPLLNALLDGAGNIQISFATQPGVSYQVQYKDQLSDATWTPLQIVPGDGTTKTVLFPATAPLRFYSVQVL